MKKEELENENTRLRAALAQSDQPCAYCSLSREDWLKCQHGFPGCARADDAAGCPELGAMLLVSDLRKERVQLREALTGLVMEFGPVQKLARPHAPPGQLQALVQAVTVLEEGKRDDD